MIINVATLTRGHQVCVKRTILLLIITTRFALVLRFSWGCFYRYFTFGESTNLQRGVCHSPLPGLRNGGDGDGTAHNPPLYPPPPPSSHSERKARRRGEAFVNRFTGFPAAIINNQPAFRAFRERVKKWIRASPPSKMSRRRKHRDTMARRNPRTSAPPRSPPTSTFLGARCAFVTPPRVSQSAPARPLTS